MMESQNQSPLRSRVKSFQYAFEGCWYVLRTQKNAWIHATIMLAVIVLALWLRISLRDWAVLVLVITIVWMAEFANSVLEALVDLISPEMDPLAKTAKDVSAGAVLVGAIGAVLVGLLILGPPLLERLF